MCLHGEERHGDPRWLHSEPTGVWDGVHLAKPHRGELRAELLGRHVNGDGSSPSTSDEGHGPSGSRTTGCARQNEESHPQETSGFARTLHAREQGLLLGPEPESSI